MIVNPLYKMLPHGYISVDTFPRFLKYYLHLLLVTTKVPSFHTREPIRVFTLRCPRSNWSYIPPPTAVLPIRNFQKFIHMNFFFPVTVFPIDQPTIDGIKEFYAVGDYIIGNCTSSRSNPAAELSWFINNDKVSTKADFTQNLVIRIKSSLFSITKYARTYPCTIQIQKLKHCTRMLRGKGW